MIHYKKSNKANRIFFWQKMLDFSRIMRIFAYYMRILAYYMRIFAYYMRILAFKIVDYLI